MKLLRTTLLCVLLGVLGHACLAVTYTLTSAVNAETYVYGINQDITLVPTYECVPSLSSPYYVRYYTYTVEKCWKSNNPLSADVWREASVADYQLTNPYTCAYASIRFYYPGRYRISCKPFVDSTRSPAYIDCIYFQTPTAPIDVPQVRCTIPKDKFIYSKYRSLLYMGYGEYPEYDGIMPVRTELIHPWAISDCSVRLYVGAETNSSYAGPFGDTELLHAWYLPAQEPRKKYTITAKLFVRDRYICSSSAIYAPRAPTIPFSSTTSMAPAYVNQTYKLCPLDAQAGSPEPLSWVPLYDYEFYVREPYSTVNTAISWDGTYAYWKPTRPGEHTITMHLHGPKGSGSMLDMHGPADKPRPGYIYSITVTVAPN